MLFLLCVLQPALRYVSNEQIVSLSTMDLSLAWRAAAMPVGLALMLVSMLLRTRRPTPGELGGFMAFVAVLGAMNALAPVFHRWEISICWCSFWVSRP